MNGVVVPSNSVFDEINKIDAIRVGIRLMFLQIGNISFIHSFTKEQIILF